VEEKVDRAVEEDPVQDREITPGIIYINRRRLETQESGQVYKITGPETWMQVASPGKMPAIPSPRQVTGNLVRERAIMPGRVPTREQAIMHGQVPTRERAILGEEDPTMYMPTGGVMFTSGITPITNGSSEIIVIPGAIQTPPILTGWIPRKQIATGAHNERIVINRQPGRPKERHSIHNLPGRQVLPVPVPELPEEDNWWPDFSLTLK
jgi:hypothetical protein